jgi:glucose/arabinose dehydrogenase
MTPLIRQSSSRRALIGLIAFGLATSSGFAAAARGDTAIGASGGARASTVRVTAAGGAPTSDSAVRPTTVAAPAPAAFDPAAVALDLSLVASGFYHPLLVTNAGDGSGRLFVVEQSGKIMIIDGGSVLPTPFLDLANAVIEGPEAGMLGLAFHPAFPARPYIYVSFIDLQGRTAINRYTVSSNPNVVNRASGVRLLSIPQPNMNHLGGNMAFGSDGYLYIGTGDGGPGGDPAHRAQNLNALYGKILRIDVNHASGTRHYRSPSTNPYVGKAGLDEIWARGLRNPWRWSFDRVTHQLWVADVGESSWEEVNRSSPHGSTPAGRGVNYGWSVLEGRACFSPPSGCSTSGKQPPQAVYGHTAATTNNCAVTGGFVYRGSAYPVLAGGYVFGDFCSGRMWVMSPTASAPVTPTLVRDVGASPAINPSSFGEDDAGELYVCDLSGSVYQVTATVKP